jgi:hypothetical protein
MAERALYLTIAAGVLALAILVRARRPGRGAALAPFLVLASAAVLLGIAAHEGGKIHRPELAAPGSAPATLPGGTEEHDS